MKGPETTSARPSSAAVRMARVRADDETWTTFRALAGVRSISEVLGDLVAAEVRRYRSQQLQNQTLEPRELLEALRRARQQQSDLELIVELSGSKLWHAPPGHTDLRAVPFRGVLGPGEGGLALGTELHAGSGGVRGSHLAPQAFQNLCNLGFDLGVARELVTSITSSEEPRVIRLRPPIGKLP